MKLDDLDNLYKNFSHEQLENMLVHLQEQINKVKIELCKRVIKK